MKYHPTKPDGMKYHPTNSPVPWASISAGTGKGKLVPDNRHRKNPSMRETSNTEGYLRGKVRGNLRGRSTHAVQSITDILLYILVSVPVKYPAMELQELHTRGRGRVQCPCPRTRENTRPWNWGVSRMV